MRISSFAFIKSYISSRFLLLVYSRRSSRSNLNFTNTTSDLIIKLVSITVIDKNNFIQHFNKGFSMESFETEQMIQYAFYINIVIATGLAWFCLRSGLHYNFFRKAESARTKGLSSTSTEHGPAIVRLKKLQALVDFISNCAFLILSIGTAYILYVWSHS